MDSCTSTAINKPSVLQLFHRNIGTVSKETSGALLRDSVERITYGLFRAHRYHRELN